MIRPRSALLACIVALCWSLGNGPSAQAQIIFPIPSNAQSDLLLAKLNGPVHTCALPPVHTCALPPGYDERTNGTSLELIQTATLQLGQRVVTTASSAWHGISERLAEQAWNAVTASQKPALPKIHPVSAITPATIRPSSPDFCPLASLLDPSDAKITADALPLSSTADQLPKLCGLENVFFDSPDIAAATPMPFTLESINRTPRTSSRNLNSGVTSGAKNIASGTARLERVRSWLTADSLADSASWLAQQVAASQSWLGDTISTLVLTDIPLVAPPQSDPGAPAVRNRMATIIVTPFGPLATSIQLRPQQPMWPKSNPLRNSAGIEHSNIGEQATWDETISLLSALNPLRPWQTWVEVTADQLVEDAVNGGFELAEIVQAGIPNGSSQPPLPEISKPSVFGASAIRADLEESDYKTDESWVDESLLPLDPAWFDLPCPCDRALEEYERKSRTARSTSAVSATKPVPAQSLGNIVTALQDSSLRRSQDIGLEVNAKQDGLTRPAQAQDIAPTRALVGRNARFGLAAGFAPSRPAPRQETFLNLEQLEMVNTAAQRLGLATGRVAQGFQEAADILTNNLEAESAVPRTANNNNAPASR